VADQTGIPGKQAGKGGVGLRSGPSLDALRSCRSRGSLGGAKCLLKEGFDPGAIKAGVYGPAGHSRCQPKRTTERVLLGAASPGGDLSSYAIDGSPLFRRRQARKESCLQHARWGKRRAPRRSHHQLSPLGPEGQWFRVSRISRVVGTAGFVAAALIGSPGGAAGLESLPSGTQQQTGEAAAAGVVGSIGKRPSPTWPELPSEGGQKRSRFGRSRFNQCGRWPSRTWPGSACRRPWVWWI